MQSIQAAEREIYEEMHCVSAYTEFSPGEKFLPVFLDMIQFNRGRTGFDAPSVLDAGCSGGKGALALKKAGFVVTLMDLTDSGLIDEARALVRESATAEWGIPFIQGCLWDSIPWRHEFEGGMQWDWVYCCDVLEHIPPEFTMLVISRLLDAATKGVFLSIALQPDNFGAWVGRSLHQTVQNYKWWHDHLSELGVILEARDLLTNGLYLVRAKP